ncbi:MAG TPA: hypothetical protein VFX13_00270 [Gaiellales bacterium]|jgi:hypothetical protein|nr:hypothetical protein [Gaiellales bacterium]
MTDQIGIVAEIRPGQRAALEALLREGPPFDLAAEGFEHHEVYLGDRDVVFLFDGPSARTQLQRLAATRSLLGAFVKMSSLVSAPRILEQTFSWDRRAEPASSGPSR